MLIGSGVSTFVSVAAFKLYTSAWEVRPPRVQITHAPHVGLTPTQIPAVRDMLWCALRCAWHATAFRA